MTYPFHEPEARTRQERRERLVAALVVFVLAAGTCSLALAGGGKEFMSPAQTQMTIPADHTILDWLALIGPIGVGLAAVAGVIWKVYKGRTS